MATRISQRSSTPRSYSSRRAGYAPHRHHDRSSKTKSGSFFLGNIDKEMTREEVYEHLRNNCNIYITKFDMPKVNTGEKDANGRIVNCAGYAFVHTKTFQQAQEMMKRRTIKIGKLNAEIKPYDQAKREASQTRYREKQRSSNSTSSQAINNQTNPPSDVEDWTITNENTHWDPTQVKLANLEPDSFVFPESAYCSDANDETMSLSQSIINSEAGRLSVRGKPAALKMEMEQTEYVNMALKTFKDNDETPTVEKINAKISEWTGRNQAMVHGQEQNPIQEETPVATFTQLNLENQQMNLLQAKTQVEDHQQKLLDNIMIAQHYQTAALTAHPQQHLAPASLTYVPTLTQAAPFEHNPSYQMLLTQSMLLREQSPANDNTYNQCYNMWYDYYMKNPVETAHLYNTTTGSKWTEIVSDNVPKYLAL
jgi:hypothetical protein